MEKNRNIGTGKQTIYLIAGKITALISTLAIPLILTRNISQYDFGLYSQYQTLSLFITSIFSLGIQTNLYYFLPKESQENKRIYVLQTYLLLFAFSLFAIVFLTIPFFSNLLMGKGEINNYKLYLILAIFFIMPPMILETLYVVNKDIKTSLLYPPISSFLKIFFIIIILLTSINNSIENIFIAINISLVIPFLYSIYYLIRNIKGNGKLFDLRKLIQQLKYSIPYGSAVILNTIIRRIDKIICITYLSTTEYAIYSLAFIGIPGIQQIYDSISQVIIVKIVEATKRGEKSNVLKLYKELISKSLSYSVPLIFIATIFAKDIIVKLFTSDYIEATPFFQLYLSTFIIGMLGAGIILRATNKTNLTFKAYTISALIILPLSFLLISKFGIWGAMSTAIIGAFIPKIIMIQMELKIIGCTISEYFPWYDMFKIVSISTLSLVPILILIDFIGNSLVYIFMGGSLYLIFVSAIQIKYNVFIVDRYYIAKKWKLFKKHLNDV